MRIAAAWSCRVDSALFEPYAHGMDSMFIDLLRRRRSVREFTPEALSAEQIALLKETALRSPTSRNLRPWRFLFVTDRERLAAMARAKPHGAAFLGNAPLGIVVCGDENQSDVWIEDCAIASILLQLCAQSIGLGSCWIQIRKRQHDDHTSSESYLREILDLPDATRVLSIIAMGHPAEHPGPIPADALVQGKIEEIG